MQNITLSNADRAIVRRAITSHSQWANYKAQTGLTSDKLTSAKCLEACAAMGIDVASVIGASPAPTAPAPVAAAPAPVAVAAAPAPVGDKEASAIGALRDLLGGFAAAPMDESRVCELIQQAVAPLAASIASAPTRVIVKTESGEFKGKLPDVRHPMQETLTRILAARLVSGAPLHVWMTGPAGSGKTTGARLAAESLGLPFFTMGALADQFALTGFVDANGRFNESPFIKAFRDGGLCLLDECDSGAPDALLAINAALANGFMALPTGDMVNAHPSFVCVAAANTWGNGATAEYVGRSKLDAAFLDRFAAKIDWPYDEKLESAVCGDPVAARIVQDARKKAAQAGVKVLITPRASSAFAALTSAGFSKREAANMTFLSGLSDAQAALITPSGI